MGAVTIPQMIVMLIVAGIIGRMLGLVALGLSAAKDTYLLQRSKKRQQKIMRVMEGRELERKYLKENSIEHLASLMALGYEGYLTPAINAIASVALMQHGKEKVLLTVSSITNNPKPIVDILNMLDFNANLTQDERIRIEDYTEDKADRALSVLMTLKNRRLKGEETNN